MLSPSNDSWLSKRLPLFRYDCYCPPRIVQWHCVSLMKGANFELNFQYIIVTDFIRHSNFIEHILLKDIIIRRKKGTKEHVDEGKCNKTLFARVFRSIKMAKTSQKTRNCDREHDSPLLSCSYLGKIHLNS